MGEGKMPAHEMIAARLRESIAIGTLPVGANLPSEAELCAAHGTSRGPVRQALATLAAEGLVVTSQGRAARVASRTRRQTVLEYVYFSRFARSVGGVAGARTIEIVRRPASVLEATGLRIAVGAAIVHNLRLRFLDGEPTMLERSCFREDVGALLFGIAIDAGSITERLAAAGVDYAEFVQEIDAVAADETDALHLGVAIGAPLLRQRRTSLDSSGNPIEYADDRYRPDLVTFTTRDIHPSLGSARP